MAPVGDWFVWLVMAGRGFGKTRMGAEWVREIVEGSKTPVRIALVAETAADARDVIVEGESGIIAVSPPEFRPHYEPSKRRLTWPNGSTATTYSATDPDQLRGPQHHYAWCDEIAKYAYVEDFWSNLIFGLRLGTDPRALVTTTPRPIKLLRSLLADPRTVTTRGATYDNAANLAPSALAEMRRRYEGTRLGRQELDGEIIDDVPGALWARDMLDRDRIGAEDYPDLRRIVVAVDPPVTSGENADECGIVVAGIDSAGEGYVLADRSTKGQTPEQWARAAVKAYHEFSADRLVAEVNNGGELVEHVMRKVDNRISYRAVRASRGKVIRAEPVSALYEQGKVHHCGGFPELEDQMCSFTSDFDSKAMGYSPDRVDALVWALTDLMVAPREMTATSFRL